MSRCALLALTLTVPGVARATDPATDPIVRFVATPQRPGWFLCDAVSGPIVALVGRRDAHGTAPITLIDRRDGHATTQDYRVGDADHGAGQVAWSLSRGGRQVGAISGINPGMVEGSGPDALPPIRHVTIGTLALDCRWLAGMKMLGVGLKRSVAVTREGGQLVYRSFDYASLGPPIDAAEGVLTNRPSSVVAGGTRDGEGDFVFDTGAYQIMVRPQAVTGDVPASVLVRRNGRWVGDTPLLGYALVPDAAKAPRLSSADVWTGAGVQTCGARPDIGTIADCMVDLMRRTGATPAAIGFTRWLSRDGNFPGYVSGWRQAGPVGIATVTFPFRANTNETDALIPSTGEPILLERWNPSPADEARADWRAFSRAHPDASPFLPGDVSTAGIVAGQPLTIRLRLPMRTCHACATLGTVTITYRFDRGGRFLGDAVERVD